MVNFLDHSRAAIWRKMGGEAVRPGLPLPIVPPPNVPLGGPTGETTMKDNLIRIATNEKLTRATHWAVFGIGLLALTFSIAATAASAF